jgi:hypothetical protein
LQEFSPRNPAKVEAQQFRLCFDDMGMVGWVHGILFFFNTRAGLENYV